LPEFWEWRKFLKRFVVYISRSVIAVRREEGWDRWCKGKHEKYRISG
jgi:hypothetical protein